MWCSRKLRCFSFLHCSIKFRGYQSKYREDQFAQILIHFCLIKWQKSVTSPFLWLNPCIYAAFGSLSRDKSQASISNSEGLNHQTLYWCSDQNMARWLWCCIQSDLFKTQIFKPILLPQWKEPQSYLFTYHFWCIIQEHVWCLWHKNPAYAQFKAMQKCYNSGSCIASCPRIETYESIFLERLWQYTHKNSSTSFLFVPDVQKSQLE